MANNHFISKIRLPSGTDYDIKVKAENVEVGTFAAGMKATTPTAQSDTTSIATKGYVDTAISALPQGMKFVGTAGEDGTYVDDNAETGTKLPVATADNAGWSVKVITDGTYATVAAKRGDLLVSNGIVWVLIPSGDDIDVTSVAVGNGLKTNVNVDIDHPNGQPITSTGQIDLNLATVTPTSQSATQVLNGILRPVELDVNGKLAVKIPNAADPPSYTLGEGSEGTGDDAGKYLIPLTKSPNINAGTAKIPSANSTNIGLVKLSDSTSSSSDVTGGIAATPKAVKAVYDLAAGKSTVSISNLKSSGETIATVTIDNGTGKNIKVPIFSSSTRKGLVESTSEDANKFLNGNGSWVALDGNLNNTTPGAAKTLTAFSQTNGVVSATFSDIALPISQVTNISKNTVHNPTKKTVTISVNSSAPTGSVNNEIQWCHMSATPGDEETLVLNKLGYTTGDSITTTDISNVISENQS